MASEAEISVRAVWFSRVGQDEGICYGVAVPFGQWLQCGQEGGSFGFCFSSLKGVGGEITETEQEVKCREWRQ